MPKQKYRRLTNAQLSALIFLGENLQEKINFKCGKSLSRQGLVMYKTDGYFRVTAAGMRYLRNRQNKEKSLKPRVPGSRGSRQNAWAYITPAELATRRINLGLKKEKLADLMGVSRQTIANWEAAVGGASQDNQKKLCNILSLLEDAWSDENLPILPEN